MRCPYCNFPDTQVKDSRPTEDAISIRRRRFCPECDSRFTTFERVQLRELTVVKKNGDKKIFDRDKLATSIGYAVRKRPVSMEEVEMLVNKITRELETSGETEIKAKKIGEVVMKYLKETDKVAYIRFASVYKDFQEAEEFGKIAKLVAKD